MIKKFVLDIKGEIPIIIRTQLNKNCSDLKFDYEQKIFEGTQEQLDNFLDECNKDHTYFKIIGVNEIRVKSTYLFENNMIMTFDNRDQQIPELQGEYTKELLQKIHDHSDSATEFRGFFGDKCDWNKVRDKLK